MTTVGSFAPSWFRPQPDWADLLHEMAPFMKAPWTERIGGKGCGYAHCGMAPADRLNRIISDKPW